MSGIFYQDGVRIFDRLDAVFRFLENAPPYDPPDVSPGRITGVRTSAKRYGEEYATTCPTKPERRRQRSETVSLSSTHWQFIYLARVLTCGL